VKVLGVGQSPSVASSQDGRSLLTKQGRIQAVCEVLVQMRLEMADNLSPKWADVYLRGIRLLEDLVAEQETETDSVSVDMWLKAVGDV